MHHQPGHFSISTNKQKDNLMKNREELAQLKTQIQKMITAEELEIELLTHATGTTAEVSLRIRRENVERLKKLLKPS